MVKRVGILALIVVVTAGAVVAIVAVSRPGGKAGAVFSAAEADARPVAVTPAISPAPSRIADRVLATLDFRVELDRADVDSVRVLEARFEPFTQLTPPRITRIDTRGMSFIRVEFPLQCREPACVEGDGPIRFPAASVRWLERTGGVASQGGAFVDWPEVTIVPRVTEEDLVQPEFRAISAGATQPTYRINPDFLAWLLLGLAVVLVVSVGASAGWKLRRGAPRPVLAEEQVSAESSPLEQALTALEDLSSLEGDEGREALDALSRALEAKRHPELARQARRLAWAPAAPDADDVSELKAQVRQALEEAA